MLTGAVTGNVFSNNFRFSYFWARPLWRLIHEGQLSTVWLFYTILCHSYIHFGSLFICFLIIVVVFLQVYDIIKKKIILSPIMFYFISYLVIPCGNRTRDMFHGTQLPRHRANRVVRLIY